LISLGASARDQHGADDDVGLDHLFLDRADRGIAGDDAAVGDLVDIGHARDRAFQHHDLGAQAHGHPGRVQADDAAAQNQHARRGHAGDAAEQQAHAAVVLQQGLGGREDGDPAGDFRHRRQQRQAALGVGHGLIGDGGAFRREQTPGLLGIGREVQVGEQDLVLAEHFPLDLLRLLHLHDHVVLGEDGLRIGDDLRPGLLVVGVGEARAETRAGLDRDGVAVGDVFAHRRRRQADAVFVLLDFLRDADAHDRFLFRRDGPICGGRVSGGNLAAV
jgi:hypothetical protein